MFTFDLTNRPNDCGMKIHDPLEQLNLAIVFATAGNLFNKFEVSPGILTIFY